MGFLIHVYSVGYMHGEDGFTRFFTYMNLFMVSMLLLVMGNNYAVLFIGWEGVGLCSYLLIGYYYDKVSAAKAAEGVRRQPDRRCWVPARDFPGLHQFQDARLQKSSRKSARSPEMATAIPLSPRWSRRQVGADPALHLVARCHGGPTPVSALIHAATMVTAGVYMIVRNHVIFDLSPTALGVVGLVGGATALFAATIGLVQNDIKRVLAYSTVSQLGYMFPDAESAPTPPLFSIS